MGNLFNPENRLFQILNKIVGIMQLSLLWFLFSLPLVTVGAATTALYYTTNKTLFKNRGYIWQEFWNSFKSNFKQSTIAWLVILFLCILAIVDFYILHALAVFTNNSNMDYIILALLLALVICWASYLFPYIARFNNKTLLIMKNAFIMAILNLLWTVLLLVPFVLAIIVLVAYPPLLFFVPGLYMSCLVLILERIFCKYMSPEDLAIEKERNQIYKD